MAAKISGNNSKGICNACQENATEAERLRKENEELKIKYMAMSVRFAELQLEYDAFKAAASKGHSEMRNIDASTD